MLKIYKLINRKKYKGIGRPSKKDYNIYKTKKEYMIAIIGEPFIPKNELVVLISK